MNKPLDASAIRLRSDTAPDQSPLAAGAGYNRTNKAVTIPMGTAHGSYYLIFFCRVHRRAVSEVLKKPRPRFARSALECGGASHRFSRFGFEP